VLVPSVRNVSVCFIFELDSNLALVSISEGQEDLPTTGIGPVREVFDAALSLRANDGKRWCMSTTGGYHTIMLCANPALEDESVALEYKIDGMLAALYLITVGVGPDPISPFVLLAASANEIGSMVLPQEYIMGMIPDEPTALSVREVFDFKPDDIIDFGDMGNSRLATVAIEQIGVKVNAHLHKVEHVRLIVMQVPWLANPREKDQHEKIQAQMVMQLAVGHNNPWKHVHFLAFKEGFNCSPAGGNLLRVSLTFTVSS